MLKPDINVTPLIDVLLVLLIIFMIVAPSKPTDFKARIPQEPGRRELRITNYELRIGKQLSLIRNS